MRDLSNLKFHPTAEKMVNLLCERTQNSNPQFFRIMVCYYICKLAATMRVMVATKDRGDIPINFYGINLGISGIGKGHSTNILEDQLVAKFRTVFFDETLPDIAERNLKLLSQKRVNIYNANPNMTNAIMDFDEMHLKVQQEFDSLGKMAFSFDSGTTAAVKQMRHKLLMAGIGSMNFEMDEMGSHLLGNVEVLSTFLELFDVGKVKQKLTKNTKENTRSEEMDGKTPTNMMLFGTPAKLFDGAKTEDEFWSFIQTGYGRRCFFGYTKSSGRDKSLTPAQIYDKLTSTQSSALIDQLSNTFAALAAKMNYGKKIQVDKNVSLLLIEYKQLCEDIADSLGDHEEMFKAEISHRYFKALKLAGAFAFMDGHGTISEDNLYHAIAMTEESGQSFKQMMNQPKNYVKLAQYIASIGREVTHVDLSETLGFYKGSLSQKSDLLQLAIAHGYKNSIIIKRKFDNGIEFMSGETLTATDMQKLIVAHSSDFGTGYQSDVAPFDELHKMMSMPDYNWINHYSLTGRRNEENMVPGFNLLVLDVDDGTKLDTVKLLLKDYTYLIHTTKRHQTVGHGDRFRVIMPMNYVLKLNEPDYKEFMQNVYEWLPFDVDSSTGQRSRKWSTFAGCDIHINQGQPLDALLFIPRTSKNDERQQRVLDHQDMSNMERWFASRIDTGNRNNQLLRYGLMLTDAGFALDEIQTKVHALNTKLDSPLSEDEIAVTIMKSVQKKYYQNGGK